MDREEQEPVGYVVAVSGGVDSVVLLDMLAGRRATGEKLQLTVAHFDHGIRPDSADDRRFVAELARRYGLPFVFDEGRLGPGASEAAARAARYAFLRRIRHAAGARAIVTAHHEDDVLETAIINLLRGTGRKGLSSLRSTEEIYRPLLETPKAELVAYARQWRLEWREDSTNSDTRYLRNYVRHGLLARADPAVRERLRGLVAAARRHNEQIDGLLAEALRLQPAGRADGGSYQQDRLDRHWFIMLPHEVAREVMAAWLRGLGITAFDRQSLERLTVAAKTLAAGKRSDIDRRWQMAVGRDELVLLRR